MSPAADAEFVTREEMRDYRADMARLFEKVEVIGNDIVEIKTTLSLRHDCPNPGLCLDLQDQVKAIQGDLSLLKLSRSNIIFAWQTWATIGAMIVALTGIAASVRVAIGK